MNEQLYNVSANPHVRDKASTHSIMRDVIIALLPATVFGFWNFGMNAIINTAVNGGDPMTVEQPAAGCGGSCASCAGCH